jgi:hypothetical protein
MGWYADEVLPRLEVATAYDVAWTRSSGVEWRAHCPICQSRSPEALAVNVRTLVHFCHACGATGTPVSFAESVRRGEVVQPRGGDAWRIMVELGERVGVSPPGAQRRDEADRRPVAPIREPALEAPPSYPPFDEVCELWMDGDTPSRGAAAAIESWGIDPASVDDECRVIRRGAWVPRWARTRGIWWGRGAFEIVIPLRDATMRPRSYMARSISRSMSVGESGPELPKSAAPAGHTTRALVFANRAARDAIRSGECAWGSCIVREGERDHLFESQHGAPVIGVRGGAWSDELAEALPFGWSLELATDDDAKGDSMAREIVESLVRCDRGDITCTRTKREDAR